MISFYGGRLLLVCDRSDRNWHARVVLGPKPEHQFEMSTGTVHLPDALIKGQSIFRAAVAKLRPVGSSRMCWDCCHWDMTKQRCHFELPESRKTGGRFAASCDIYEPAKGYQPPRP